MARMGFIGPDSGRQLRQFARFATAGFELAASIVVGFFGGGYLDERLSTAPALAYAGLALGIVAGFWNLFKLARSSQADLTSANDRPDNHSNPNPP
jgi:F0F1-type ATP synthase assembly protein I